MYYVLLLYEFFFFLNLLGLNFILIFLTFHRTNLLLYFPSRQLVGHQLVGSGMAPFSRPSSVAAGQGRSYIGETVSVHFFG